MRIAVSFAQAPDVAMFAFSGQSILALPMMAFAFQCHVTVRRRHLPHTRRLARATYTSVRTLAVRGR